MNFCFGSYAELMKPVDRVFGAQLGIPLTDLPRLLEAKNTACMGCSSTSDRNLAFRQVYFTYYEYYKKLEGIKCLKVGDRSRFVPLAIHMCTRPVAQCGLLQYKCLLG